MITCVMLQVVFSAIINSVGSWIRCIAIALPIDKRYPVVVVGQAIAGVGGPFAYKYVGWIEGSVKILLYFDSYIIMYSRWQKNT